MTQAAFSLFNLNDRGVQFVTVSLTGQIRCWLSTGLEVKKSEIPVASPDSKQIRVTAVALDRDTLALGTKNGQIVLVDTAVSSQHSIQVGTRPVSSLCFAKDSSKLFLSEEGGRILYVKRRGGCNNILLF